MVLFLMALALRASPTSVPKVSLSHRDDGRHGLA